MTQRLWRASTPVVLLAASGLGLTGDGGSARVAPFAVAGVYFEQNATDRDVEVVFEIKAGTDGLARLTVVAPDGRTVVDVKSPDASTLGLRQFRFESPERGNVAAIKAAYPEGVYTFEGATASGAKFHSTARLSHALPAPVTGVHPAADARGVATTRLVIRWTPVDGLAAYRLAIEAEELHLTLTADLPGSAAAFVVPDGWLRPATEYVLAIGTVTGEGNAAFVESTFRTAAER